MRDIYLDDESAVVGEHFAVVFAPRRQRDRFPENCVQVMESEAAALAASDPDRKLFPAKLLGPSRSSEGLRLYYLVSWLT